RSLSTKRLQFHRRRRRRRAADQRRTRRSARRRVHRALRRCVWIGTPTRARRPYGSSVPAARLGPGCLPARGFRMTAFSRRRPGSPPGLLAVPMIAAVVLGSTVVVLTALWAVGLLDLTRFRSGEPSTAGLVAIPTPGRPIPAYTKITRDYLWDAKRNRLAVVYLPPRAVTREMLVGLSDVIGRVVGHDKLPGYVFTDDDFLPKGTREGIVAGIPAGKRAIRVPAEKVEGVFGLHNGDRFDLVATMPIDASRASPSFNVAGVYSEQ